MVLRGTNRKAMMGTVASVTKTISVTLLLTNLARPKNRSTLTRPIGIWVRFKRTWSSERVKDPEWTGKASEGEPLQRPCSVLTLPARCPTTASEWMVKSSSLPINQTWQQTVISRGTLRVWRPPGPIRCIILRSETNMRTLMVLKEWTRSGR